MNVESCEFHKMHACKKTIIFTLYNMVCYVRIRGMDLPLYKEDPMVHCLYMVIKEALLVVWM
jgi:hypothetical protein